MNLTEVASLINQNLRFKVETDQMSKIIDVAQKLAFNTDLELFKVYKTITLYTEVPVLESGFTVVEDDIGTTVTQATSGFTGTLRGYFNDSTNSRWSLVIERDNSSDDWNAANYAITNTLSLAATSDSTKDQADATDFQGPYPFPTSPPVRKMWGITTVTDEQIFGSQYIYVSDRDDYGLLLSDFDERRFLQPARVDPFKGWITIKQNVSIDADDNKYRFVYWRNPETITDFTSDNDKFLIPDAFQMEFVELCVLANQITTIDEKGFQKQNIDDFLEGFWARLSRAYTPQGKASNQISEGNYP